MSSTRGRLVQINQVILDQADFFQADGYTRVVGLTPSNLVCQLFYNNLAQPWPFIDGGTTSNTAIKAGNVYWTEVVGSAGIYNVRFRPNAAGYWRLLISYPALTQIMAQDFDVVAQLPASESGLKATFVKP